MDGARLTQADLQGADLSNAQLEGADLSHAQLQGAEWYATQLQSADLTYAHLEGTQLLHVQLQGADLLGGHLQGAFLSKAQLQGADLRETRLQGADLSGAAMAESRFRGTFVFCAEIGDADLATAAIDSAGADNSFVDDYGKIRTITPPEVEKWIAAATVGQERTANVTALFARLKRNCQEAADQPKWSGMAEAAHALDSNGAQYRRQLADRLGDLVCAADGAPYVARAFLRRLDYSGRPTRLSELGDQLESVRKRMKAGREKPDACKGVAGFTEDDWRRLDAIKPAED